MKRIFRFLSGIALMGLAGCVSIYDNKVQVRPPEQVDQYQRNVLDKCDPHTYPHRLIQARAGIGSPIIQTGGALVNDQENFDKWWSSVTPQLDNNEAVSGDLKPVIDWNKQTAYFVLVPLGNSCQKAKPFQDEMTTDCYAITIPIFAYSEGSNCQDTVTGYPIYIYIYPKTNLPVAVQWIHPTPVPTFTPSPTPTPTPVAQKKGK